MTGNIKELQTIVKEQKQLIDKLTKQNVSLFEHSKVGVVYVDNKGYFFEVNKKFCEIVGYDENELLTLNFRDITYEEDIEKDLMQHESSKSDGTNSFTLEKRYLRKNGKIVWCEIFINHIKDEKGKILFTIGLISDISKRKKIQDTILEQTKTMQLYLDIVDVMIVAMNKQGNVTLVNRKTCETLGYEEEGLLGRNWFNNYIAEEDRAENINKYLKIINKETDIVEKVQNHILCKNGKKRVILWRRAYLYDDKKNIIGLISSGDDITDILKLEKENKKREQVLFNQSKMASMGEMLRNIAHQWRQPLSTISTAASGVKIQKELNILKDEDFYNSMDAIVGTTKYLSQTIDDFQNFFKIDNSLKEFPCSHLLENIKNLINTSYKANDIEFIVESCESGLIHGYFNEIIQIVINILNNAKDAFTDTKLENKVVIINTKIKNKKLVLTIKDNAGGIPRNIIDKIFEPYFTTKHQSLGTGIGLYMTKNIIENRLHGSIEVKNENVIYNNITRKGAVFKLTIPCSTD
ncbi:MAG: hypothetical protein C0625_04330 [Arcobacter sp.]|nr:MAG: hypothetical protein C0625_04330 [Arcobacter sp.]